MATDVEPVFTLEDRALLDAGRFLAEREVYGLVLADRDLTVRARFGRKAEFIAVGCKITDEVIPFIGSETFIESLQTNPSLALEMPGVVIHTSADKQERYNLSLFWSSEHGHYFLLIARASLDATLEIELLRHVRARLMAEAQTRATSEQLARANRDLEDFAAIVSHDLKAPMRALNHVAGEADAALLQGHIDEARVQLEWLRTQTRRMSAMLTGLLDYSTIGRKVEAIERVDTRALAEGIAHSIPASSGKRVMIEGDWPSIATLKAPLELVLRNLVDNAVKHHDCDRGTITLTCAPAADALNIAVADDGPGIAPGHRDAVFLPFRTLASPGQAADGIGLGLALVRRTLEGIGGAIHVRPTGAGARGTAFEVRWPRTAVT